MASARFLDAVAAFSQLVPNMPSNPWSVTGSFMACGWPCAVLAAVTLGTQAVMIPFPEIFRPHHG